MDESTGTLMTQLILTFAVFALAILGIIVYAYLEYRKMTAAEQRVARRKLFIALGHGAINLFKVAVAIVVMLFASVFWLAFKENPPSKR